MINSYAYDSKLLHVPASFKAIISLSTLAFVISTDKMVFSVSLFLLMSIAILVASGLSFKNYIKMCKIPFVFLLIGTVTIAFTFSSKPEGILSCAFFSHYLVMTKETSLCALSVLTKSFACINCLYFLYVSTPIEEILGLMHKIHLPSILNEMMLLILRMIFVLSGMKNSIQIAQKSRLSNLTFRTKLKSACVLISSIFIKSFIKSEDIYNCMLSRGYQGHIQYTENLTSMKTKHIIFIFAYILLLGTFTILLYKLG